jgi:hypothetical protein
LADVLIDEKAFIYGFDNYQEIIIKKYGSKGMVSKAIVGTCQVAVEVLDAKIPDLIPGPMDEGMPEELDYVNFAIPAPPGMHPFETIIDWEDEELLKYLTDFTGEKNKAPDFPTVAKMEFDSNKMKPMNGKQVNGYLKILEICEVLGDFQCFLSDKKEAKQTEVSSIQKLLHKCHPFLLLAKGFQK